MPVVKVVVVVPKVFLDNNFLDSRAVVVVVVDKEEARVVLGSNFLDNTVHVVVVADDDEDKYFDDGILVVAEAEAGYGNSDYELEEVELC